MDRKNSCNKQISYTKYSYRVDNGRKNQIKTYNNNRTSILKLSIKTTLVNC